MPAAVLRGAAALHLAPPSQPTPPGRLDLALAVRIMDTSRARSELGWSPRHGADETIAEVVAGIREGAGE